ncbi:MULTISPECIES: hypothetical protein [Pseudanabaena]|uniref:Uncharacterized protein n=2 Tax=Pseudanabaena TaxID=1152 RepID=L8MUC5_9CYAN|nr:MULTISPECIES: hypothetical protein [Pseudanabaena]ELS31061.1 hypothetical protein Pse7429DRAFT_3893 [Pseudanabaena biceps PCC 7429]MDG3496680.1 hypothetical protein [Pseudanabaena catenata USMAC16]
MKKTLFILCASILCLSVQPVQAGPAPVVVTPTSNSPIGSENSSANLLTINVSDIVPQIISLVPAKLDPATIELGKQGLILSLQNSGFDAGVSSNLVNDLIAALSPALTNGDISISGDGKVSLSKSTITVNQASFNQAIQDFNAIIDSLQGNDDTSKKKRADLLNNKVFMAISAFLRAR